MKNSKNYTRHFFGYLILIALGVFGFGAIAQAGIEIIPGVGYQLTNTFSYKFNTTQVSYNETAIPLSLKVAFHSMSGFAIGVDGGYFLNGSLVPSGSGMTGDVTDTFTRTVGGAFVGYFHPMKGFKVWAGYNFVDSIANKQPTGTTFADDFTSLSGTSIEGGIGYAFSPHVALTFTYEMPTYTSITPVQGSVPKTFTSTTYNGFTDNYYYLSLAFPFGH